MKRLKVVQEQLQNADDMLVAMKAYVELIESDAKEYLARAMALKAAGDKVDPAVPLMGIAWLTRLLLVLPQAGVATVVKMVTIMKDETTSTRQQLADAEGAS